MKGTSDALKKLENADLNQLAGILGMLGAYKGPMSGLAPVLGTNRRAEIIDTGTGSHMPMPKTVDLMYGKKLVMRGPDKGKII